MKKPGPQAELATFPILELFLPGAPVRSWRSTRQGPQRVVPTAQPPSGEPGPHAAGGARRAGTNPLGPGTDPAAPHPLRRRLLGNLKSEAPTPTTRNHRPRLQVFPLTSRAAATTSGAINWSPGSSVFPAPGGPLYEGADGRAGIGGEHGLKVR